MDPHGVCADDLRIGSHKNAKICLFAICFIWFDILWADLVVLCFMLDFSSKKMST